MKFPLDSTSIAFVVGGVGIFLYGLVNFSDSLKEVAGIRLKSILDAATKSPWRALFVGIVVTGIIQASSVVTVVVLAFVNSGLLTFEQSLGLIFGANIGTTVTAQIIAFNISIWGFYIVPLGLIIYMFAKKRKTKYIGQSLVSFGCLLIGLSLMEKGLFPLRSYKPFIDMMGSFGSKPFNGIIAGTFFTALIQSSSATTSIVVSMAKQGLITLQGAIPIVFGSNIGTTITTGIASIGTKLSAKRVAVAHFLFNTIGVTILFFFIPSYTLFVVKFSSLFGTVSPGRLVANSHTIFNVVWSLFWVWQVKNFASVVKFFVPGKEKAQLKGIEFLDNRLIHTPSLAIDACKKEIFRMATIALEMLETQMKAISRTINFSDAKNVYDLENLVNEIHKETLKYLRSLYEVSLTEEESQMSMILIQSVDDIERWGDHATNLYEVVEHMYENDIRISKAGVEKLNKLFLLVTENIGYAAGLFENTDRKEAILEIATRNEYNIDKMVKQFLTEKCTGYMKGETEVDSVVVYSDIINNLERTADHAFNIVELFTSRAPKID